MSRADTDDFRALFLEGTPLIDTRAPVEFGNGAFPMALSLPLMTDDERAAVGTCYKQQGQEAAILLGHKLVKDEVKAQRVQAWLDFAREHPNGYLYCFRGGLRSKICQQWLAEAGCDYPRITGGYKAMRRFLIDNLDAICQSSPFTILAGRTGCAKTELLVQLPGSVDLEGLANHRGSAFGKRVDGQPTQIDFENAVSIAMLRTQHQAEEAPLLLEDEGHFIGSCVLPESLRLAMTEAPLVVLESDLEQRVEHSFQNYILSNLIDWQQLFGKDKAFDRFANSLRQSLTNISKRLGGERYQKLSALLEQALSSHKQGDNSLHRAWIKNLLKDYYDPMYDYQLSKKADRIQFRGSREEVRDYLLNEFHLLSVTAPHQIR